MRPLRWVFRFVFGWCHHSRLSRVFTIDKRTYQICLECGEKFDYSWTLMRRVPFALEHDSYAPLEHSLQSQVTAS
jgi:hypothetical protein